VKKIGNSIDGMDQRLNLIDSDSEMVKSYYLNGIKYDEESYNEIMQEREGLPWYKNTSMKNLLSDYRN
jgi:hypothetical protein